jgi:NDP-sugar pyrophosphorylase family protein
VIPLAILAGGRGTRLGSLTRGRPKSLVDVSGVPFLRYQLAWAASQGVRRVVLCVGHRAGQIRSWLPACRPRGLRVALSDEGRRPRGTAAALRRALPLLGRRFLVLYGDSYLPVEYARVERAQRYFGRPALMVIHRNAGRYDRSNVQARGGRVRRYVPGGEAGLRWIDAGLSVLEARALSAHPSPHLTDLMEALAASGALSCWRSGRRFYEVGSPRGLAEFRARAARLRASAGW